MLFRSDGGAILAASGTNISIEDSSLHDNNAVGFGGAICALDASTLSLVRTQIGQNDAGSVYDGGGGGGLCLWRGTARISDSTIVDNVGRGDGGGGVLSHGSNVLLVRSTIAGNNNFTDHYRDGWGGGMAAYGGALTLENCTVTGNNAGAQALGTGGGIAVDANARLNILNSIVAGNEGGNYVTPGRALYDISGTITSSNGHNVFSTDVAGNAAGAGGIAGVEAHHARRSRGFRRVGFAGQ